jgi:hypothetical protein
VPSLNGPFILGIKNVVVEYNVRYHDDGSVKRAEFALNGEEYTDNTPQDGLSFKYDIGKLPSNSVLETTVYDDKNLPSRVEKYYIDFIELSVIGKWGTPKIQFNAIELIYTIEIFKADFDETITIPDTIPKIGGQHKVKFNTLVNLSYSLKTAKLMVVGEGGADVKLLGRDAEVSLEINGGVDSQTWTLIDISLTGSASFELISEEYKLTFLPELAPIPSVYLTGTPELSISGTFANGAITTIEVEIYGELKGGIKDEFDMGGVKFKLEGYALLGVGINGEWCEESCGIGATVKLEAGAIIEMPGNEYSYSASFEWNRPIWG